MVCDLRPGQEVLLKKGKKQKHDLTRPQVGSHDAEGEPAGVLMIAVTHFTDTGTRTKLKACLRMFYKYKCFNKLRVQY